MLSTNEIRRWLNSQFTSGTDVRKALVDRELPRAAFCRACGMSVGNLSRFQKGDDTQFGPHKLRMMARFIGDWEAGLLEFGGTRHSGRTLIHRDKPRARPPRMTLDFSGAGPRLKVLPRAPAPTRIFLTAKAK